MVWCSCGGAFGFLSTLSLRRATKNRTRPSTGIHNFYPRSPCGERLLGTVSRNAATLFLSTLSLRRATIGTLRTVKVRKTFLSTLSLRRATYFSAVMRQNPGISIHALLAESDGGFAVGSWRLVIFLSTLSLRRATNRIFHVRSFTNISIHALLAESDKNRLGSSSSWKRFLSTLSLRRATARIQSVSWSQ